MSEEELRKYYDFLTGVWKFFKAHHDPKTDQEWQETMDAADELARASPFKSVSIKDVGGREHIVNNGAEIMVLVMCELEELYRRKHVKEVVRNAEKKPYMYDLR